MLRNPIDLTKSWHVVPKEGRSHIHYTIEIVAKLAEMAISLPEARHTTEPLSTSSRSSDIHRLAPNLTGLRYLPFEPFSVSLHIPTCKPRLLPAQLIRTTNHFYSHPPISSPGPSKLYSNAVNALPVVRNKWCGEPIVLYDRRSVGEDVLMGIE